MTEKRCGWAEKSERERRYHDEEWGRPERRDSVLFEFLILEGMQAGLSWRLILSRREAMCRAFDHFDVEKIARYDEAKVQELMEAEGVIKNRLKLRSLALNAQAFLRVQEEWGSFSRYLWHFVEEEPILHHWQSLEEVPASTPLSDQISRDLKKRGFRFVGSVIVYSYLQAMGLVNDHLLSCEWHRRCQEEKAKDV